MNKTQIINWLQNKEQEIENKKITKAQNEGKIENTLKAVKDQYGIEDIKKIKKLKEKKEKELKNLENQIETRYNELIEDFGDT